MARTGEEQRMRRRARGGVSVAMAAMLAALGTAAAGCGAGSGPAGDHPSAAAAPRGLIALGHSELTGAATDPGDISLDVPENSWATGTDPTVRSIYARLLAVDPSYRGHVANTARDGSKVEHLDAEATAALAMVPRPRLAIVQDVGNDIGCDGRDVTRYRPFGTAVQRVLQRLVRASPTITIVAVPWLGRPIWKARALLEDPRATVAGEGTGPCALLTPQGRLNRPGIRRLTRIVDNFDASLQRACAAVERCVYASAATRYVDHARDLARDWNHLGPTGHARLAALLWPTVARALHLT
jgi:hypothetical protein